MSANNSKSFNYEEFKQQAIVKIKLTVGIMSTYPLKITTLIIALQNKRNGYSTKTIKADIGQFEIDTPRDRDGSFEPQIIKKRQTILTEDLDNKIISLYAGGMSYSAISSHIKDMYGIDISTSTITNITDKIRLKNLILTDIIYDGTQFVGWCPDLQNRGVKDILIACIDGLIGFGYAALRVPEAIKSIFPQTEQRSERELN